MNNNRYIYLLAFVLVHVKIFHEHVSIKDVGHLFSSQSIFIFDESQIVLIVCLYYIVILVSLTRT
nr:MAG TPA_asm: hypothetical protein [Caudoviricetes sp.]